MKRPQRRSKRKSKKMLRPLTDIDWSALEHLANSATYSPSPYHKRARSVSGQPAPRPDKTICDRPTVSGSEGATVLLASGFLRGMVSLQRRGEWPQNVWAVDDEGIAYEAQLGNAGLGDYHGYPMKIDDGFTRFIHAAWKERNR